MSPLIIGIAGGTGSGKSTVARKVAASLTETSVACIDIEKPRYDFVQHLRSPRTVTVPAVPVVVEGRS